MVVWLLDLLDSTFLALVKTVSNLFIPFVIFVLLAIFFKRKDTINALKTSLPDTTINLSLMTLNVILISPIILQLGLWMDTFQTFIIPREFWEGLPKIVILFFVIFIGDFIGYWRHRIEHSKFLWPLHAVHHSDTAMSWLTLHRIHPITRISTFAIDTTILLLLGFPPYAVIANSLVRHYYGYFVHADLPWNYGPLGKVLVSPIMHRWHHAAEYAAYNTNFAQVFSIFDICFGTYRVPKGPCNAKLGVSDNMGNGLLSQITYPLKPSSYKR